MDTVLYDNPASMLWLMILVIQQVHSLPTPLKAILWLATPIVQMLPNDSSDFIETSEIGQERKYFLQVSRRSVRMQFFSGVVIKCELYNSTGEDENFQYDGSKC